MKATFLRETTFRLTAGGNDQFCQPMPDDTEQKALCISAVRSKGFCIVKFKLEVKENEAVNSEVH